MAGPFRSLDIRVRTDARLAPALSPLTAMRPGSAPELAAVLRHPEKGRVTIFRRGRVGMLRGEPVVHRDSDAWRPLRESEARVLFRIEVSEHPSAAVKIEEDGQRRLPGGRVDADRHGASRPR